MGHPRVVWATGETGIGGEPEQWPWSSFRAYAYREKGPVRVNFQEWELKIRARKRESFEERSAPS